VQPIAALQMSVFFQWFHIATYKALNHTHKRICVYLSLFVSLQRNSITKNHKDIGASYYRYIYLDQPKPMFPYRFAHKNLRSFLLNFQQFPDFFQLQYELFFLSFSQSKHPTWQTQFLNNENHIKYRTWKFKLINEALRNCNIQNRGVGRKPSFGLFWIAGKREVYFKTREQVRLWAYYRCNYIYIYIHIHIHIRGSDSLHYIFIHITLFDWACKSWTCSLSFWSATKNAAAPLWNAKGMQMSWILKNWAFFSIAKFGK